MKICFLDKTEFQYSEDDKYSPILRGAETILINLSNEFRKMGHYVTIYNNCPNGSKNNWRHIDSSDSDREMYDLAISNADANLFNKIKSIKKIVLSYSLQSLEKFIRKNQLFSYLKHKPTYFLIGEDHKKNRSKVLSLFGSNILKISVDDIFLKTNLINNIDSNQAIFTSRVDRNLDLLLEIWSKKIFPRLMNCRLLVTPSSKVNGKFNIINRELGSQKNMINDLLKSRIYLVPGHKAELYCLAAEEARELCIPIVTLGIGSLSERVINGKTGFIAKNNNEFAEYTIELFNNENLWLEMKNNLLKLRGENNWNNSAIDLLSKVKSI